MANALVPYSGGMVLHGDTDEKLKKAREALSRYRDLTEDKIKDLMRDKRGLMEHFSGQKARVMSVGGGVVGGIAYVEFSNWVLKTLAGNDKTNFLYVYRGAIPALILIFGKKIPLIKDYADEPWFIALMSGLLAGAANDMYQEYSGKSASASPSPVPAAAKGFIDSGTNGIATDDWNLCALSRVPEYANAITTGLIALDAADMLARSYLKHLQSKPGTIPADAHSKGLECLNGIDRSTLTEEQHSAGMDLYNALSNGLDDIESGKMFGRYKGMNKQQKVAAKTEEKYRKFVKKNGVPPSVEQMKLELDDLRYQMQSQQGGEFIEGI